MDRVTLTCLVGFSLIPLVYSLQRSVLSTFLQGMPEMAIVNFCLWRTSVYRGELFPGPLMSSISSLMPLEWQGMRNSSAD